MNIHKIDIHLHQSFLEEERKDAITGDLIQANDEVVFCGVCKSAFLKDSWEYIGKKHCGQAKTLKSIPVSKPLLLNITTVKPTFITLTNSSISFEQLLKNLSSFKPQDKKVEILLDSIIKKGTKEYVFLLKKARKRIEQDFFITNNNEIKTNSSNVVLILVLLFIFILSVSVKTNNFVVKSLGVISVITLISLLIGKFADLLRGNIRLSKPTKNIISLGNLQNISEINNSITFGVFNQDLFFYFEELQKAIFIKLLRVNEIEIKYQADCYVLIQLKRYNIFSNDIEIPLIFSKNSRITKFLIALAESKKSIESFSRILVTDFPADQRATLANNLSLYPDIIFV